MFLGLKSKQGGVTASFLQAYVYKRENIYVKIPRVFRNKGKNGNNKVLKLKNTFYGLIQIPRNFWNYLTEELEACVLDQSKLYHCFFVEDKFV